MKNQKLLRRAVRFSAPAIAFIALLAGVLGMMFLVVKENRSEDTLYMHGLYRSLYVVAMSDWEASGQLPSSIEAILASDNGNFDPIATQIIRERFVWITANDDYVLVWLETPSSTILNDRIREVFSSAKRLDSINERRALYKSELSRLAVMLRSSTISTDCTNPFTDISNGLSLP